MKTYIALFRGLNMGGHNIILMKELTALLEKLGLRDVWTYVQSGNAVFRAEEKDRSKLSVDISDAIEKSRGFRPQTLVLEAGELKKAIDNNHFPEEEGNPSSVAFSFLFSVPAEPDFKTLESVRAESEKFKLIDNVFYMYAPDGFGRSKLAARAEKCLGVPTTSRSWNTVCKIHDMLTQH